MKVIVVKDYEAKGIIVHNIKENSEEKVYGKNIIIAVGRKGEVKEITLSSDGVKADKEVILEGCKIDGQVLYYASKELRDDKEVVLEAVKNKGIIVKYASERLLRDNDIIIAALTQNKKASIFIPIECREREEIKAVLEGE